MKNNIQYILDINNQISYNPIKHINGVCGCGIAGALGAGFCHVAIASQWEILLTPMANMYVKFS
jgi:hypothetical protein